MRRSGRWTRLAVAVGVLSLLGSAAGCSGGDGGDGRDSASTTAAETSVATESTVAPTTPVEATTAPAPPVVAAGPCPYLDQTYVEEAVGDRMDRVETITVDGQPAPDCVFYLLNGSVGVTVDLTPYADVIQAQNAALALVTSAAQPETEIGDYGGVLVAGGRTILAVTVGTLMVAVVLEKESSLQAREIAATVVAALPAA